MLIGGKIGMEQRMGGGVSSKSGKPDFMVQFAFTFVHSTGQVEPPSGFDGRQGGAPILVLHSV